MKFIKKKSINEGYFPTKKSSLSAEEKLARASKNSINNLILSVLRDLYHKYADLSKPRNSDENVLILRRHSSFGGSNGDILPALFNDIYRGYDYNTYTEHTYFEKYEPVINSITTDENGKLVITIDIDTGSIYNDAEGALTHLHFSTNVFDTLFPQDWGITGIKNEHIKILKHCIEDEMKIAPAEKRKGYELLADAEIILNKVLMCTSCNVDIVIDLDAGHGISEYQIRDLISRTLTPGAKTKFGEGWENSIGKLLEFRNKGTTKVNVYVNTRKGYIAKTSVVEKSCKLSGVTERINEYAAKNVLDKEGFAEKLLRYNERLKRMEEKNPGAAENKWICLNSFTRTFIFDINNGTATFEKKDITVNEISFLKGMQVSYLGNITIDKNEFHINCLVPQRDKVTGKFSECSSIYAKPIIVERPPVTGDDEYMYIQNALTKIEEWCKHYIEIKRFPIR